MPLLPVYFKPQTAKDTETLQALGTCGKIIVNALPKVVGFLQVLWSPPTGNVDRLG